MLRFLALVSVLAPIVMAFSVEAAPENSVYGRDLISVVTLGRHATFPTANCVVWVTAEGLGVGPAELNGYHGVSMNINLQPLANEPARLPTPFSAGIAEIKSRVPTTPAWLLKTIEKNRVPIEAACAQDHPTPFTVYTITARDKQP